MVTLDPSSPNVRAALAILNEALATAWAEGYSHADTDPLATIADNPYRTTGTQ